MTRIRLARCALFLAGSAACGAAQAQFDVFGIGFEHRLTLGYAVAMRIEDQEPALVNGPIDVQQVYLNLDPTSCAVPPCLGSFGHTGMPITANYDDNNRDFERGALLNNRLSAYGEAHFMLDSLGFGDIGVIASGAAFYDRVQFEPNDHDDPDTVNRMGIDAAGNRYGPIDQWTAAGREQAGRRTRLLEAYAYGLWSLGDTTSVAVRAGRHLAAWGESLFFPGIASAMGPYDASKANVPGVEVKEILLPVNQVSVQVALGDQLTLLAYNQFEFDATELFPQGDFFAPADVVGPGASFSYGAINPLHDRWCGDASRVQVFDAATGAEMPAGSLCTVGAATSNEPEYIQIPREPDRLPDTDGQFGAGLTYQLLPDLSLGAYYLRYNSHTPHAVFTMGSRRIGDAGSQELTTSDLGLTIPQSYALAYAADVEMQALSFSTVLGVFNVSGELTRRLGTDISLEADILGVISPVSSRGDTTTAQVSGLYVMNPDFLFYDEVAFVGEAGYTRVDRVEPRENEPGICYSGTDPDDCNNADPVEKGEQLFYDEHAWAFQVLVLPKGRNVFQGWDLGTPVNFAWLVEGTPAMPGVFGALYGEGDMRASLGVTLQYLQNFEVGLSYNAYFGDVDEYIGNSAMHANPFIDHDYLSFTAKYSL